MTGTDANANQLSDHAKHHLALAGPRGAPENRLLHVGIGPKGWGHNTCIGNPGSQDLSPKALEALGFPVTTPQLVESSRNTIDAWLNAVPGRRLADYDGGSGTVKPDNPLYTIYGANFARLFGSEGCMHTDDAYVTVSGLTPGTDYTAEALFRLVSEEEYIGGQGAGAKAENFIPTWDGGFYPGGIWSPTHLAGTITFTTNP